MALLTEVVEQRTFLQLEPVLEEKQLRRSYSDGDIALMSIRAEKPHTLSDAASTAEGSEACDDNVSETTSSSDVGDLSQAAEAPDTAVTFMMPMYFNVPHGMTQRTTVMMKNLPNKITRTHLVQLLNAWGFVGQYDFVYVPIDFKTRGSYGYGVVNMLSAEAAAALLAAFNGFSDWGSESKKVCKVEYAKRQGLPALLAHYRDSKLMHEAVPDEYRPATYWQGQQVALPSPTWRLKQPYMKPQKKRSSAKAA